MRNAFRVVPAMDGGYVLEYHNEPIAKIFNRKEEYVEMLIKGFASLRGDTDSARILSEIEDIRDFCRTISSEIGSIEEACGEMTRLVKED